MSRRERDFPREVRSIDELPGLVAGAVRRSHADSSVQRIITIPAHEYPIRRNTWLFELPFGWRRTPERTLVFGDERITVVEADQHGALTITAIPLAAVIDLHLVEILLYAFVEFAWVGAERIERMRIEYNLVGQTLMQKGIDQVRTVLAPRLPPGSLMQTDLSLADLPLMFRNYLRRSLLPTERLSVAAFQPAIPRAKDRFHRFISPNRTLAVTDRCVIVIEDQKHRVHRGYAAGANYAVIRHFYPLDHIDHAAFDPAPDALWLRLRLGTARLAHEVSIPLAPPRAEILRQVLRDQGVSIH